MNQLRERIDWWTQWLTDEVLPLQMQSVRDSKSGGFHERIRRDGSPVEMPRRARVSARQLYSFSKLTTLGLRGPTLDLARVARDFLFQHHIRDNGHVVSEVDADGRVLTDSFDLYDVAFTLFGLAATHASVEPADSAHAVASNILSHTVNGWRHPEIGFEESVPYRLPLRANPHMHLLEACLEWVEADCENRRFPLIASEVIRLAMQHFIDPDTGLIRELFDHEWDIYQHEDNLVEPGHQFEWGWLFLRWGKAHARDDVVTTGIKMIETADTHGVYGPGLIASTLSPSLTTVSDTARLWPHTERIKALAIIARHKMEADEAVELSEISNACDCLFRFFDHPLRGSWWENLSPSGDPLDAPARTSSLYHIVCAYSEAVRLCNSLT